MIVNDIGVTLEYTDDAYDDGPTVLFHAGGGANTAFSSGAPIAHHLRTYSNARTVAIKYELGEALHDNHGGWHLRASADPSDYVTQTERTADVIQWIVNKLANSGEDFGTVACSMGALATLAAPVWHGYDGIIGYQALVGGPPMWDVNAGCGLLSVSYMDPYDAGIATDEIHGGVNLGTGDYCNVDNNHCLTYLPVQSEAFKNHVHRLDPDVDTYVCYNAVDTWPATDEPIAALDDSSFAEVTSPTPDWMLTHRVDFFVDRTLNPISTGKSCDGTNGCADSDFYTTDPEPWTPAYDRDETLAGPSTVRTYQELADNSTTVSWTWQEGTHCDSMDSASNAVLVRDAVIDGLDVEAAAFELRVVKHADNFTETDVCLEYDTAPDPDENVFSDSATLAVHGRTYRVGTYHDDSGSPELQATIADDTVYTLPEEDEEGTGYLGSFVDRVRLLVHGSRGAGPEDLRIIFDYDNVEVGTRTITSKIPTDDTTTGTWSGPSWRAAAWQNDVTGNGSGCADGSFAVGAINPLPSLAVTSVEVEYDADLEGPLALSILVDSATWDEVESDNSTAGCDVTEPITTACELQPVLSCWN